MAKNYTKLAKNLLKAIGGRDNVISITHCVTRLRFVLKDKSKANTDIVKCIEGVITVVEKGGQFQVVIGNAVPDVFEEVVRVGNLDTGKAGQLGGKQKSKDPLNILIDTIAGIFPPILGILCGAGLIKGLVSILVAFSLITEDSGTFLVLNTIGDSVFRFMPVILGFTAGKKFEGNPILTAIVGASLIHPNIVATAGTTISFLGIPMVLLDYSSTVIPILLASYLCCKMEKLFRKTLPVSLKNFFTPMLCLLITVPATLFVIGPAASFIANGLADGYSWIYNLNRVVAGVLIGGLWQVLVIFGLHWGLIPIIINNLATLGYDTFDPLIEIAAVAQAGAAFGIWFKMKDKTARSMTFSAALTGTFGITEPIIYGVTLPRKKPFIMGCIGGAVGAGIAAAIGAMDYAFGGLGIFFLPVTIGPEGFGHGFWGTLIGMIVAFVVAGILAFVTYKDDTIKPSQEEPTDTTPAHPAAHTINIYNPVKGEVLSLSQSDDAIHAEETLGKGAIILPDEGKVYSPFDGAVSIVYDTHHAIGLVSDDGLELLIHVGIDTVNLNGKYFTPKVQTGDQIKTGQLLLEFDMGKIAAKGFALETQVIVLNTPEYNSVTATVSGITSVGDMLLQVKQYNSV